MTPVAPVNNIIVQLERKFNEEIVTKSGFKFFLDPSYSPEWHATVTGKVVSVPPRVTMGVTPIVQPGDELFFSYLVVADMTYPENDDSFHEVTEKNPVHNEYENGNKDRILVKRLNKKKSIGIYLEKGETWRSGVNGSQRDVEKWLTQFKFGGEDRAMFANLLWYNDQDYWIVPYDMAIALKRGEEIIMLNGNVLLEPPVESEGYEVGPNNILRMVKRYDPTQAKVLNIGQPARGCPELDVKPGDMVRFNPDYIQKYEMWGKNYHILPQTRLIAKT